MQTKIDRRLVHFLHLFWFRAESLLHCNQTSLDLSWNRTEASTLFWSVPKCDCRFLTYAEKHTWILFKWTAYIKAPCLRWTKTNWTQWNSNDTHPDLVHPCSSKASPVVFLDEVQQKSSFSIGYGHNLYRIKNTIWSEINLCIPERSKCCNANATPPLAVRSTECLPVPSRECTPGKPDGTCLSRIGPICLHICSKWSGAICLLAAILWRGEKEKKNHHVRQMSVEYKRSSLMSPAWYDRLIYIIHPFLFSNLFIPVTVDPELNPGNTGGEIIAHWKDVHIQTDDNVMNRLNLKMLHENCVSYG